MRSPFLWQKSVPLLGEAWQATISAYERGNEANPKGVFRGVGDFGRLAEVFKVYPGKSFQFLTFPIVAGKAREMAERRDCSPSALTPPDEGVLQRLLDRPYRFNELCQSIDGLSGEVLSENLKQLEADDIVVRTAYLEVPTRVEYSLGEVGESMRPIIAALQEWGLWYKERREGLRSR